mgnify:CR=1 FL=1
MLGIAAAAVTVLATGLVLWQLRARQILDHPNERSSHDLAVPRGGGQRRVHGVAAAPQRQPAFLGRPRRRRAYHAIDICQSHIHN